MVLTFAESKKYLVSATQSLTTIANLQFSLMPCCMPTSGNMDANTLPVPTGLVFFWTQITAVEVYQ
jgi:hypothetical protein